MVTLNTKKDFDSVYKSQKRWHNPHFILFFKESPNKTIKRVGFSVSKKIGNAVCRNLIKRRLRSIYRESVPSLKNGDMVLLAKVGLEKIEYKVLQKNYEYALMRLNLVAQEC
ncbi:ribonuclease P protein component [Helicobacter sp. MIT 05-5294]|uniref:ribonuclease P protein component n=1 Tax=Helicobacter sp. MIT 05-5294 TaxID=1548150 RepID=UPI00051FE036|nr:ribonuclease P protein component [Helicobacter sp. MIT 05-5294]TLD87506.1 ribonuclease P protein component [Helicobacter sp. MIT 05-5294]